MWENNQKIYEAQKKLLQKQSDIYKEHSDARQTINILGIGCSTRNSDDIPARIPASHHILSSILQQAHDLYPHIKIQDRSHILQEIDFDHCEANYSMHWEYCTRPCWISQRKNKLGMVDPLTQLYDDIVDWADIVIVATPIRRGNASSLYYKLVERLNCIENQQEVYGVNLIHNKLMWMVVIGAQDGVQHVMGQMMSVWAQFGFAFAANPYVAYTSGWFTNTRTDLVAEQLNHAKQEIDQMIRKMLDAQIQTILHRRK